MRSSDGEITQMVENAHTAWHAGNWDYNQRSIGIEHEGFVDQPSYLTDELYTASANLTRWLCDTHGVPKTREHIIGHNEVPHPDQPGRWGGRSGHTDPCITIDGSQCHWDWTRYMQLVGGHSPPTTGTLIGFVYSSEGGCHHDGSGFKNCDTVVAGARVNIPETGQITFSESNGRFQIELPPGHYTPSAWAEGYHHTGPVLGARPVTAGENTFSSIILQKIATTALVEGFVYLAGPDMEPDTEQPIEGVFVSQDASNITSTGHTGAFRLTVPAGAQTLVFAKAGFLSRTLDLNLAPEETRALTVALTLAPGEEDDGGSDDTSGGGSDGDGSGDEGSEDGGSDDGGTEDGAEDTSGDDGSNGTSDGGESSTPEEEEKDEGCGCGPGGGPSSLLAFGLLMALRRRARA